MHIRGNFPLPSAAGQYSVAAIEKSEAVRRVVEARKRLLNSGAQAPLPNNDEDTLLITHQMAEEPPENKY